MKNLKFIPVLLVLFVAFIASNSFADKPTKYKAIETWESWSAWAPCGNNGAGEWISGDLDIKVTLIFKDKGWHGTYLCAGGVCIGEDSGEKFRPIGAATNTFNYSGDGGNGRMVWINHYIGDMGTKLKVYTQIHWTVNANGIEIVNFDHSTVDCK